MSVDERAKKIIAEIFKVDPGVLLPETCYVKDLRAKSANIIELIAALEDEFGITIPLVESRRNLTVGDTIAYLNRRLQA